MLLPFRLEGSIPTIVGGEAQFSTTGLKQLTDGPDRLHGRWLPGAQMWRGASLFLEAFHANSSSFSLVGARTHPHFCSDDINQSGKPRSAPLHSRPHERARRL